MGAVIEAIGDYEAAPSPPAAPATETEAEWDTFPLAKVNPSQGRAPHLSYAHPCFPLRPSVWILSIFQSDPAGCGPPSPAPLITRDTCQA